MNSATKILNLLSLTADLLTQVNLNIDNVFSSIWKHIGFNMMLRQVKFSKRSGTPASDIVYLLMLWVWLKVDSVAMFSREALLSFSASKKMHFITYDALYNLLNRALRHRVTDCNTRCSLYVISPALCSLVKQQLQLTEVYTDDH